MIRVTILYDNTAFRKDLSGDWGFSALVEAPGRTILFDTGARGDILLEHMEKLSVSIASIDCVFISHDHWDHTGGLDAVLALKPLKVYVPFSAPAPSGAGGVVRVSGPVALLADDRGSGEGTGVDGEDGLNIGVGPGGLRGDVSGRTETGIFSTGELSNIEQSLVVVENGMAVVVVGCSHPGVGKILAAASGFAPVRAIVGGLHGFNRFELLSGLEKVVPTHCTQHGDEIRSLYPDKYTAGGAGRVLEF